MEDRRSYGKIRYFYPITRRIDIARSFDHLMHLLENVDKYAEIFHKDLKELQDLKTPDDAYEYMRKNRSTHDK